MASLMQGLTVQLHPYQQQALQFMLDNERNFKGSQGYFWYPFAYPLKAFDNLQGLQSLVQPLIWKG